MNNLSNIHVIIKLFHLNVDFTLKIRKIRHQHVFSFKAKITTYVAPFMFTGSYSYLHWRVVGKGDNNVKKVFSVEVSDSSPLQHLHHVHHNPIRGDQIFFSATCPGQVAYKNPLVLRNFLLVPKYFSNRKSIGQVANTTISLPLNQSCRWGEQWRIVFRLLFSFISEHMT